MLLSTEHEANTYRSDRVNTIRQPTLDRFAVMLYKWNTDGSIKQCIAHRVRSMVRLCNHQSYSVLLFTTKQLHSGKKISTRGDFRHV